MDRSNVVLVGPLDRPIGWFKEHWAAGLWTGPVTGAHWGVPEQTHCGARLDGVPGQTHCEAPTGMDTAHFF
jgi:hypothetical protein